VAAPSSLCRRSFWSELRVVWAFSRINLLVYSRYPLNPFFDSIWTMTNIFQLVFTGVMFVGAYYSTELSRLTGIGDFVSYWVLGGLVMTYGGITLSTIAGSLRQEMQQGTLESCWMAPIRRFVLLTNRILLNLLWVTVFNTINVFVVFLIFKPVWNPDWFSIIIILLLTILSNYSFGILMGGLTVVSKNSGQILGVWSEVLMILSAYQFPIAVLGEWSVLSNFVPYYYSIRAFRAVVLQNATFQMIIPDLVFLTLFSTVFLALSYAVFKRLESVAKRRGSLGFY